MLGMSVCGMLVVLCPAGNVLAYLREKGQGGGKGEPKLAHFPRVSLMFPGS